MEEERIPTVIKEINYWKQHKLLPEMYCDYLLALYTNGEDTASELEAAQKKGIKLSILFQLLLQLLLVPFSILVIYFTDFSPIMQLSILFLFIGFSFVQYWIFKKEKNISFHISLIIFLLLILLTTVYMSNEYIGNQWLTNGLIIMQFLGWLLWSQKKRLNYLMITSIVGVIFTTVYIVL